MNFNSPWKFQKTSIGQHSRNIKIICPGIKKLEIELIPLIRDRTKQKVVRETLRLLVVSFLFVQRSISKQSTEERLFKKVNISSIT